MEQELRGALEENVLTLLCFSEKYAARVALAVSPDLFSTRAFRRMAEFATTHLAKYSKPPRVHLRDNFESEIQRGGTEGEFIERTISSMERIENEVQAEVVLDQISNFVETRRLGMALDRATELLNTGHLDQAREALYTVNTLRADNSGVWLRDTEAWLRFLDPVEGREFSCGIDTLDERGVYLRRGEVLIFLAATRRGKSWYLIEVGKRALWDRKNVLHISLENQLDQCQMRWTQALLGLSTAEVTSRRITLFKRNASGQLISVEPQQIALDRVQEVGKKYIMDNLERWQKRGNLRIDWFPNGYLTVPLLASHLDALQKIDGFVPDIVVLDYLDEMSVDTRNYRIDLGRLVKDLRGLAGMRNFALFTATQANRSSENARLVTLDMVGEDWSKMGTADIVLTYSQTRDEMEKNIARVLVAKARGAEDGWLAWITQNYAAGQFCLDSAYFSNLNSGEIRRYVSPDEDDD